MLPCQQRPIVNLYDSHNHLQDERLNDFRSAAVRDVHAVGLKRMVVNGTSPEDWFTVRALSETHPGIIPSYGVHPWNVNEIDEDWREQLREFLVERPSAVGEIGLDRWIDNYHLPRQEEVFLVQWRLAVVLERPVTIHCLKAWGWLFNLLRAEERAKFGFLLHSYGGPLEMVKPLAELGAYFSMSGYFAHPRKSSQADVFRHIPHDRLLLETDAPDMWPPAEWKEFALTDRDTGKPVNHPANIRAVYRFAAELRKEPLELLARQVEENFLRLFGSLIPVREGSAGNGKTGAI